MIILFFLKNIENNDSINKESKEILLKIASYPEISLDLTLNFLENTLVNEEIHTHLHDFCSAIENIYNDPATENKTRDLLIALVANPNITLEFLLGLRQMGSNDEIYEKLQVFRKVLDAFEDCPKDYLEAKKLMIKAASNPKVSSDVIISVLEKSKSNRRVVKNFPAIAKAINAFDNNEKINLLLQLIENKAIDDDSFRQILDCAIANNFVAKEILDISILEQDSDKIKLFAQILTDVPKKSLESSLGVETLQLIINQWLDSPEKIDKFKSLYLDRYMYFGSVLHILNNFENIFHESSYYTNEEGQNVSKFLLIPTTFEYISADVTTLLFQNLIKPLSDFPDEDVIMSYAANSYCNANTLKVLMNADDKDPICKNLKSIQLNKDLDEELLGYCQEALIKKVDPEIINFIIDNKLSSKIAHKFEYMGKKSKIKVNGSILEYFKRNIPENGIDQGTLDFEKAFLEQVDKV